MGNLVSLLGITIVSSTSMLCKEATHTAHYLVCLGGGVEGSSVERGPLLALVPLLEGDTHHRGRGEEGRGGEGQFEDR